MSKVKKYEIETLEQLINIVTPENFERLSIDFLLWLDMTNKYFAELKKLEEFKDKTNSEIAKVTFLWLDDGKNEIRKVQFKNTTTAEVTEVNVKFRKEKL